MKRHLAFLFFCLSTIGPFNLYGQAIDSLSRLLKMEADDRKKVDILLSLAYEYYDMNDTLGFNYSRQALQLSKKIKYPLGIKQSYSMVGVGYTCMGDILHAKECFIFSDKYKLAKAEGIEIDNFLLWSNLYREVGYYDSSLIFINRAMKLARSKQPEKMASVYKSLAAIYILQWKNRQALSYLDSANQLLKTSKDWYDNLELNKYYGKVHLNLLNLDESKKYYEAMCEEAEKSSSNYHKIECKLYESAVAYRLGEYTKALTICFEGLELTKSYLFPPQYIDLLTLAAEINFELSQNDFSAEYLYKALKLSESTGLKIKTAQIYDNLAWLGMLQGNLTEAEEFINKSIQIAEELNAKYLLSDAYTVKSLIFRDSKKFEAALKLEEKSFSIKQELDFTEGMSDTYYNKGLLYEDLKDYDKALEFQLKSLAMEEEVGNIPYLSFSYYIISRLYIRKNDLKNARVYLEKAEALAQNSNLTSLKLNNAEMHAMYYEVLGDYKKALEYQKEYQSFSEQINSEKGAIKLAQFAALYGAEKKDQENQLLIQQRESQESKIQLQQSQLAYKNIIIISTFLVLFLLIIGGLVFYQNYLDKSRTNKKLLLMNTEMTTQNEFINSNLEKIKQLQSELQVREEQYRTLVESAHDAIFEVGEDGRFIYSNPIIESVSEYSIQEVMNMHFSQFLHPQLSKKVIADYFHAIKRNLPFMYIELPILTKSGKKIWIGQNVRFFYRDGRMYKAVVVARDISAQKQAEIDLKIAKEAAENANAAKSEFLANVSHELRTPLNGVIGFTDLLSGTPLNETQRKYLKISTESAQSLLTLIDDILDFSKLDSGKLQLSNEMINMKAVCNQVVDMIRPQAEAKGLQITTILDSSIPDLLFADEMRIKQVLTNLLGNSVKFTSKGSIKMLLTRLPASNDEMVKIRFSVIDTGIGIAQQNQHRIFEAFVQEDISTTKKYGGTGLGLTISNKILALMNSSLQLNSQVNKGSEFYFDLHLCISPKLPYAIC